MHQNDFESLKWIQSNGGPLLLLSRSLLSCWNGARSSTDFSDDYVYDPSFDCHYNRACAVEDYVGLIGVGDGVGLVLDDSPDMTTWCSSNAHGKTAGILIRWEYADSEANVLRHLKDIPEEVWKPTGITFKVENEPLYLFDSAYAGRNIEETGSLLINLQADSYEISIAYYQPDAGTRLLLHGFQPV